MTDLRNEIVVDNFACGGGASEGIENATGEPVDHAINHNAKALAVHMANHPYTRHWREDIRNLNPRRVGPGLPIGLGWFSPDCTFHSKARGGKPFRDSDRARRVRGLAGSVHWWMRERRPRVVMLENVEEFTHWGPLLENGKPDPKRRGQSFRRWHKIIENLGYQVDMRELVCADYGVPTSRKRLFVIARCDGEEIVFPEASHGFASSPYRTAAECIDWSIPCPSIFTRQRPLAEATLRRIARGVMRYVVNNARPFIVPMTHAGERAPHSIDEPLRTITTAKRGELALCTPFIAGCGGRMGQSPERSVDRPFQTITSKADSILVSPTLINTRNGERVGQAPRVRDLERPYPTITAAGSQGALVAAFLARHYGGHENDGHPVTRPMSTITTQDHHHLVTSNIVKLRGDNTGHDVREPLHTISAQGNHLGEVRAFLLAYYGNDKQGADLRAPMRTVTTKERFGLVTVRGEPYEIVDIGMRMLEARELARASSFPDDYILDPEFEGKPLSKTDQVWMIGNAVPPLMAEALVRANYSKRRAKA